MEKVMDLKELGALDYRVWLWGAVDVIRGETLEVPVFCDSKNGCIRLTVVPLCKAADDWMGGGFYREFRGQTGEIIPDVCEREYVFKIHPLGSHTIQYICDDGHIEPVNCYGYSALKTAWRSWARKYEHEEDEIMKAERSGYMVEDNGWSVHDGSLSVTFRVGGQDFLRLYVCVSGAESCEDEQCSFPGVMKAQATLLNYCDGEAILDNKTTALLHDSEASEH